jgi:NAD(P) transhydrogenase subunit beta
MSLWIQLPVEIGIIALLLTGIFFFSGPNRARRGNMLAAAALLVGVGLTIYNHGIVHPALLWLTVGVGGLIGWRLAARIGMIQMPAMVAFQHGCGGIAAGLVAYIEMMRLTASAGIPEIVSGGSGLVIGSATFSASLIAAGKLGGKIRQTPRNLPGHSVWMLALVGMILALGWMGWKAGVPLPSAIPATAAVLSVCLGILLSIRIGGADMPVLISFLNATAGIAAACCGILLQSRLLVIFGATVAASGTILTLVMCRGMNRKFNHLILGSSAAKKTSVSPVPEATATIVESASPEDRLQKAIQALQEASSVVLIPGYGMALAQAQFNVVQLAVNLHRAGKKARFAIHPVAGRMPGHMHVLLAEADVDYDLLLDMDDINEDFVHTDVAVVVGACDVVNPAAMSAADTPLSGMPILKACDAGTVIVCNLNEQPGYSGVENTLYGQPNVVMLLGDAKETVSQLIEGLAHNTPS